MRDPHDLVDIVPFERVAREFAAAEGEGDGSLEYWREVHWTCFTRELRTYGRDAQPDMPVACERFEVVFGDRDKLERAMAKMHDTVPDEGDV